MKLSYVLIFSVPLVHGLKSPISSSRTLRNVCTRKQFVEASVFALLLENSRVESAYALPQEPRVNPGPLSDLEEALSGAVGGAVVSSSKILVKHPLDTITVRLQLAKRDGNEIPRREVLFQGLYDGVLPPLLFAIPSGSIFFSVKDFFKSLLKKRGFSKETSTLLGVFVAQFPYWLVRNPSELIKTRAQSIRGGENSTESKLSLFEATKSVMVEEGGISGLYQGYGENIAAAFPADALKFLIYEACTAGKPKEMVPPIEGAAWGAFSTALSQAITTPFDVVRNRAMTEAQKTLETTENQSTLDSPFIGKYYKGIVSIARDEGGEALWTGLAPRVGKALLSGAVQFGSYEVSRSRMARILGKN